MGDKTGIEWSDATWNPIRGCSRVSTGCEHCYAERVASRFSGPGLPYDGLTCNGLWTGEVRLIAEKLEQPLRWRRPRRIFVNSMSDLFHPEVPSSYIADVFVRMLLCPEHTFQVLTKRPERMLQWFASGKEQVLDAMRVWPSTRGGWRNWCEGSAVQRVRNECWIDAFEEGAYPWPLPNVLLGVSAEDQAAADDRIPPLLECPAAVRWVSVEPMLGPVDLRHIAPHDDWHTDALDTPAPGGALDWVVCGGESGPGARPVNPQWVRSLRDQCRRAGVPFLFKQWGEWGEPESIEMTGLAGHGWFEPCADDGGVPCHEWPGPLKMGVELRRLREGVYRVGKKAAGRRLDGAIHDEYPEATR